MPKLAANFNLRFIGLLTASLICLVIGASLLFARFKATTGPASPPTSRTITQDTPPSEAKPNNQQIAAYNVPADRPRSITLPTIGASGLVQKVGVTKDNAVATPSSIYFAGWYTNSVAPGKQGLSIIDGHVSGKYADGIFKKLKHLKKGDEIAVEFGDKSIRKFETVSVTSVPEAKAAAALFAKHHDIADQLNLITCTGAFNKQTQRYADRVIVVAKLAR